MFGESVFAMIPDHDVRAAKLTNRWISGCWWRRDACSDKHLVGTKFGLLKCRSVRRKPPGEQWNRRETLHARGSKWNFDVEIDTGVPAPLEVRRHEEIPTASAPVPPSQPESQESVLRGQGVRAKALRIRACWSEIGRTPECPACETLGPVKSHTRECQAFQDVWEDGRRTATVEEVKRGIVADPDTRALDPNSNSTDVKPGVATDVENSADRMDEDTSLRAPATSHPLELDAEEDGLKRARAARNVLHILGEDELKFDVNEEAWPNAGLAIRSSSEGALIDGLAADKVKPGDEREIAQMKDLQLYSWVKEADVLPGKSISLTGWARRMKGREVRSRCVLKGFATKVRDDVFAPTPSPVCVRGLLWHAALYDLRVEIGYLGLCIHASRLFL